MTVRPASNTSTSVNRIPDCLGDLVKYLQGLTERASIERLHQLLTELNVGLQDLQPFMSFGPQTYRRNLICENEWFELLCICWRSGQRSPIHNHAGSTCGLRIIEGVCTETVFELTDCGQYKPVSSSDCSANEVCSTQDEEVHQVSNLQAEGKDLVTLHIYSPPLRQMDTYSLMGATEVYEPNEFHELSVCRRNLVGLV